jgi:translation initiation factor IF-2
MTSDGRQTSVADATPRERQPAKRAAAKIVVLPATLSVKRLAELTGITAIDVIKQLMRNGMMASMNQVIDFEVATLVTSAFGVRARPEKASAATAVGSAQAEGEDAATLVTRPPVVTIMGHVDHGKTTLLDTIRKTRVAESEFGNITQHIGAYQVRYKDHDITFLDTPGHEAFTAIRARGASVTDIAVLVVAADDGVMPQTVEALDHAQAAKVPVMVAINKMDRPEADPERVKRQLTEHSLVVEEWGGDTIAVPMSAMQGEGISDLLESILVVAELGEFKADPDRTATGVVIEAKLDKTRGPLATVLVQNGTLRVGDRIIAGTAFGRVKAMLSDTGERVQGATPSVPVEVMGFGSTPEAGDVFEVVDTEKAMRDTVADRARNKDAGSGVALTLEEIYTGVSAGDVKEVNLVIKADVQGSVEAVSAALQRLDEDQAKVRILHAGSGTITENDVLLAAASSAIVVGFNTTTQPGVDRLADREGVEVRHYRIIYHLIEDIEKALQGLLEATFHEVIQGHAAIRAIFSVGKRNKIAGCMVSDGRIARNSLVRVIRGGAVLHEGNISSLRHFKEEVPEMAAGFECGVGLGSFTDFQEGDVLETYRREKGRA